MDLDKQSAAAPVVGVAKRTGGGAMGERLDLGKQIASDIFDALRCCEEYEVGAAPMERLLTISSLAGQLAAELNALCLSLPISTETATQNGQASGAHTARNEGRSPTE